MWLAVHSNVGTVNKRQQLHFTEQSIFYYISDAGAGACDVAGCTQ